MGKHWKKKDTTRKGQGVNFESENQKTKNQECSSILPLSTHNYDG